MIAGPLPQPLSLIAWGPQTTGDVPRATGDAYGTGSGIGGVFFRSADPDASARWYAEHLGVDPPPESYDTPSWQQQAGPTVLAGMPPDSEHFGSDDRSWAINFRVENLDAMVEQLRSDGIDVTVDAQVYPNGRFADLHDPDGNPIQLWQPAGPDLSGKMS